MTIARSLFLLGYFGVVAVAVVALRAEQARMGAEVERLQRERLRVRRASWELELEVERLRSPGRVAECVSAWALDVAAPLAPSERNRIRLADGGVSRGTR